ncbi:hypothetical protein CSC94_05965 [Zhengella mangrovi]|uniref:Helix-turn-helix domain-containing protein n=1 Tax=Zhengella mangrovi TaxID=1982044 RepID=A0A2G1QRN8_9HYPH|nr:helix-turn-helix domain-containing protein [Zhengella mangrovi]PHP68196.1 hypothetical protein CSC94_05965 [Zhengella mangrovi]
MSHAATDWAIQQRGLKPATKLVLWHLCDRYHPDHGCFPSQDTLAHDCEMSRSSLNEQLLKLEEVGLIRREQRRDERTNRAKSTIYRFKFESGFADDPCPESGHGSVSGNDPEPCPENAESRVQNLDTNPVREPVIEPVTEREARESADEDGETENRRKLEARVKRLEQGKDGKVWPGSVGSSTEWAVRQFAALSETDRLVAEERRDAYLAECKRQKCRPVAVGVYLRDRKFEAVEVEAKPVTGMPEDYAPAFGPVWSAWRTAALVEGGKESWIAALDRKARVRSGHKFGDIWFALKPTMEPVTEGSPKWQAWQRLFEARGWTWIPPLGNQSVAYFPKMDGADPPAAERALVAFVAEVEKAKAEHGGGGDGEERAVQERGHAGSD